ncbi:MULTISPECIES: hypothetical protein [unclassified Lentimonas]|uniref:hypothetical protein n=1 Tax=unclassified Lentimonas TaxID=2630993 RepID=UPI00132AA276|nr:MULTISPECIES: hypothetical protein [unclassified Lentimonas]CAA6676471.1 Unannotated [Lentimonas sp. CC4]CAA6685311.1 Unannotated [Lentimonas sp. CC6]CAA7074965.1 Unannotated [Lentimonas sp. CC4]CAA7168362.1 Unannotated [Lentimonas sp. CC21]
MWGLLGEGRPPRLPRSTLPSAEPQHRTKALNQSTSTPQDEAELVPPQWIELEITILDERQYG